MDKFVAELDEEMHGINKVVVVLLVVVAMRAALGARAREGASGGVLGLLRSARKGSQLVKLLFVLGHTVS